MPATRPLRAYRALLLAGCFATGIVVAAHGPQGGLLTWVGVAGIAVFVVLSALLLPRRRMVQPRPIVRALAIGVLLVAAGALNQTTRGYLPADHVAHRLYAPDWTGRPVWIEGQVASDPVRDSTRQRFTFAVSRVGGADTVRVQGRVRVTVEAMSGASGEQLELGTVLRIVGRLRPVPRRRNPADFDYGRYLRQHGIHALMTVPATQVSYVGDGAGWSTRLLAQVRGYVRGQLQKLVSGAEERAILSALTLGERHQLDDALREGFVRTGLMHLLAVSGLHVLVIGMVLYQLLKPALIRLGFRWHAVEWTRTTCTLVLLTGYMLVTGAPASVVRAVMMAVLGLGSVLLQRKTNVLNLLGAAAFVLLAVRPAHLFEAGFQLSFSAVAALVLLVPVLRRPLPQWTQRRAGARYLTSSVLASLAATLGTMPVLLYHFGYTSFAGLLLNVVAIPLTLLGLGAILVALLVAGLSSALAILPAAAAESCVELLVWTARTGEMWLRWSSLQSYVRDEMMLVTMLLALLTLAAWPYPRRRWRLLGCVFVGLNLIVWMPTLQDGEARQLDVIFFDVGHGDAALLTLPNGSHVLVDAGPRSRYVDHGQRTIVPHLRRYGIDVLDLVVITHADADHLGGLPTLLRSMPVRRVVHNGLSHDSDLFVETMALLDSLSVSHHSVQVGDTLHVDDVVRLQVLHPTAPVPTESNDASVVLRMLYGRSTWLLTGDVEAEGEALLTARYGRLLRSDVVKVPHHGSSTSSTSPFVRAVAPDTTDGPVAVVSVSRFGRFDLPDDEVLMRWQRNGSTIVTTSLEGAVWLRSNGQHIERVYWRY